MIRIDVLKGAVPAYQGAIHVCSEGQGVKLAHVREEPSASLVDSQSGREHSLQQGAIHFK